MRLEVPIRYEVGVFHVKLLDDNGHRLVGGTATMTGLLKLIALCIKASRTTATSSEPR